MENILLPSKMTFAEGSRANESILTIEPLHHGYGTTVGNVLRRVLLSSLEGAAVTAMKIKGVQHEFSSVTGAKEDGLEIALNLKKLRMIVHTDQPVVLTLEAKGEGEVKAKDISANADVEIANPDLVIATLTSNDAKLNMEITVGRGRGFWPTEERDNSTSDIGTIAIDSVFSPVLNVGIKVENTRVGEITNYDKLIMNILTDGTITAQDAVSQATKVILNHFNWIENQFAHSTLAEVKEIEKTNEPVVEEVNEETEE
ncbi:DNA-directed RNA polymerase subunit alpha [Candidatus Uhrbacteria bacterium CG_4_9_14_0_2_um_filter_41_50]|uniref:DNA-directed RNA polymerase subunit alpha n=1 Tax=Candidatus Uhrbacteria bacterium CG_4_9_14_0_2_um_filter_41_50 TaxID=1975031 RepID=A0A2M8EQ12_9BACT|nr:MAG: DNA-directed RNA polymerase subunit alpha [Candidatus Uhrbacteria bacterium CG_4_10_14_3_um_filter_41_21]PIZ54641.1 MAG: DNA-directed RNA polymerase subunit alpha [Candidatus Uhrbacteria bacterium CG_4_10_14_0_2_um_filter_41_21]PJB84660.1 MAG: DNA-directed RNA polymerase subunit alpha [Candidatus Uhrbacteria bacterium CG_4_9_14_0_8_um_filter_41_16]PJC24791.1 MAG: DNA-directed RNA polymerase subunit alpha [Candidatus Uhrbacteria bacterium CG_4_9_14_0_2_um_filter_41_50]PJE75134.1 MAG: DNA